MKRARILVALGTLALLLVTLVPFAHAEGAFQLLVGRSVTVINNTKDSLKLQVEIGRNGKLDYALYDSHDQYDIWHRHGSKTDSGSILIPAGDRAVVTNDGTYEITLKDPSGKLVVIPSSDPALKTVTIRNADSLTVTNETSAPYAIYVSPNRNGRLDYVFYDSHDQYDGWNRHNSITSSTSMTVPAQDRLVMTNSGGGDITLSGPYELFHPAPSTTAAHATTTLQPGNSIRIVNESATYFVVKAYLGYKGKMDYVTYDGSDQYDVWNPHGSANDSTSVNVPSRNRVVLTNTGSSDITLTGPYELIKWISDPTPAISYTTIAPGKSFSLSNTTPARYYVRMLTDGGGKYGYAYFDSKGQADKWNPSGEGSGGLLMLPAGDRLDIINRSSVAVTVTAPYELSKGVVSAVPTATATTQSTTATPTASKDAGSFSVKVTNITSTTATIEWSTPQPMASWLLLSDRDEPIEEGEVLATHSVTLTDLSPGETYTADIWMGDEEDGIEFVILFTTRTGGK